MSKNWVERTPKLVMYLLLPFIIPLMAVLHIVLGLAEAWYEFRLNCKELWDMIHDNKLCHCPHCEAKK